MYFRSFLSKVCLLSALMFCLSLPAVAQAEETYNPPIEREFLPWFDRVFVHAYASQMAKMDVGDFLWAQRNLTKVMHDYMFTLGGGVEKNVGGGFAFGAEANASLHWGYEQDTTAFGEFSAGIYLRYYFPWSKTYLPSIAVGDGLSFNTIVPNYEKIYGTGNKNDPMDSKWLNYLFIEVEMLRVENVSLFYRLHHRCTIFGLIGSDYSPGGINFHSVGLRYSF